jgi:ribosome-binding factor A
MAYRKEKLEHQIRRLISELLIKELKDPRIGFATITEVTLNNDFTQARVGVSVLGDPRDIRKSWEGINSAKGFIQKRIGKLLSIRHIPKIEFFLDSSIADGVEMVNLLNKLENEENSTEETDSRENGEEHQ